MAGESAYMARAPDMLYHNGASLTADFKPAVIFFAQGQPAGHAGMRFYAPGIS